MSLLRLARRASGIPRARWMAAAVVLASLSLGRLAPAAENAADRATARTLAQEGQEALLKQDYATAADRFGRAHQLLPAPTILLQLARAQVGLGKLVEAQESYNRIVREGAPEGAPAQFLQAIEDAKQEVSAVEPRIAWVTITVKGANEPNVTIDGQPFSAAALGVRRAVNPGPHEIIASSPRSQTATQKISLKEGEAGSFELTLVADESAPAAAPPTAQAPVGAPATEPAKDQGEEATTSSPLVTVGWIVLGVGGAGLVFGTIEGVSAMGKHDELEGKCEKSGKCPPEVGGLLDEYETAGSLANIGFIAGGIGVAAGVTLLLVAPPPEKVSNVTPYIGIGTIGARGTF